MVSKININWERFLNRGKLSLISASLSGAMLLSATGCTVIKNVKENDNIEPSVTSCDFITPKPYKPFIEDEVAPYVQNDSKLQCIIFSYRENGELVVEYLLGYFYAKDYRLYVHEIFDRDGDFDIEKMSNEKERLAVFSCDAEKLMPYKEKEYQTGSLVKVDITEDFYRTEKPKITCVPGEFNEVTYETSYPVHASLVDIKRPIYVVNSTSVEKEEIVNKQKTK